MPPSQSISSKSNSAVQPATPVSTSPRHALSATGDSIGDFRTPFSGPPSTAQPLSYGYPMELENDSHHAPGTNGCKYHAAFHLRRTNDRSTCATAFLSLPTPYRHSVATDQQLLAVFYSSRKSIVATFTFDSEFCIRKRIERFRWTHSSRHEHELHHVLRSSRWTLGSAAIVPTAITLNVLRKHRRSSTAVSWSRPRHSKR
jgi:hypothetical protein